MGLARVRRFAGRGAAVAALLAAGGCGSSSAGSGAQAADGGQAAGGAAVATGSPGSSGSAAGSAGGSAGASSSSSGASQAGGAAGASSSAPALPENAKGDHQKVVDLMDAVQPSGLPIQRTAELGTTSRVYQAIAGRYGSHLLDLNATGYGDAESSASTYIVVLGQLRPSASVPDVVSGTLGALGATGITSEKLGVHAQLSSLVMSCGVLPNKYELCVWSGGSGDDVFLGAVETPAGMSLPDTALFAESVFGYVAP
jgi:hypothetical protein